MMKVLPQQLRLYAVTDSRRLRGRTLLDTVAAALDGGSNGASFPCGMDR